MRTSEDLVSLEAAINETNSRYLGIDLDQLVDQAGKSLAHELLIKYGKHADYAFLCGLGNNGGDGMAAARHLARTENISGRVTVYLVGRQKDILTTAAATQWQLLQELVAGNHYPNLTLKQDVFAPSIESHHIIVECLSGSGRKGDLKKRFRDVIKRATHFRQHMVALDNPVPGYTWELSLSLLYPKTADARVIGLKLPSEVSTYTGPGEVKALFQPRKDSYKSQNGKLLIIGGAATDSGSTLLAARAASIYAAEIYIYPSTASSEFKQVNDNDLEDAINQTDAILIGIGWEESLPNKALLNYLLATYPDRAFILVGAAITMADITLVKKNGKIILLPQRSELPHLLGTATKTNVEALEGRLRRFTAENHCYINLRGSISLLFGRNILKDSIDMRLNKTGQQMMGRPGAESVLAGITAAFATKNDPWLSLTSAAFTAGLAGDLTPQVYGESLSVDKLVENLKVAWEECLVF